MTFGKQVDETTSRAIVGACLDAGVNFFDTANAYNGGISEEYLGRAIRGVRDEVVISSKVFGAMGPGPNDRSLSRRHILTSVEGSLRRLGTDYLDIYLLHSPDYTTPLEETLSAMDALVRGGKVRYIGCSNYASWQLTQALWLADRRNLVPLVVAQPMYNLLARGIEQEFLPCCQEFGVGVMVYNPLAGGLLTGKYKSLTVPPGTRFDVYDFYRDRYLNEVNLRAVEKLSVIASSVGKSLTAFSIQWCLNHPDVHVTILGASRVEQIQESLGAFSVMRLEMQLPPDVLVACDAVWRECRIVAPQYNR
jgi:aryl-alcohol dehydrogenase (NADP+)